MRLPPEERAAHRAAFAAMATSERLDYIFSYYKLELAIVSIAALVAGTIIVRILTHRDAVLYLAYANVAVESGLDEALGEGFVTHLGLDPQENEVYRYHDLYLSDDEGVADHRYAYASHIKLLGAIDAEQLDVVIMGKDAYDILSSAGYLADLPTIISGTDPETQEILVPLLVANEVVVEDNMVEYNLGETDTYQATVVEAVNAVDAAGLPLFEGAGFSGQAYLGVIANSPRQDAVLAYLEYLSAATF
ncbi:hypothetical protein EII22_07395 [Coriobacteriales bacterium OH1046]|nr:hypothetical protein EII22_07395 [Coriobacteriales bacterium OH1046]